MKTNRIAPLSFIFLMTLIIMIVTAGCAPEKEQAPIEGLSATLAVRTMVALRGVEYFATFTPTAFPTPTVPIFQNQLASSFVYPATATPVPSLTPIVPVNYQNAESFADTGRCQNKAEFIEDITCADATGMKGGQPFTKTWLLRNSGTCTWTKNYKLVFTLGDKMGGTSPTPIGREVMPGETIEISVDLVAPKNPDYYQGNWMLQDEEGILFGTGYGKNNFIWVSIVVGGNGGVPRIFGGCRGGG